jgi:hypothetical protein
MSLRPNSELVTEAWLRGVPDLADTGCGVGTKFPSDPINWGIAVNRVYRFIKVGPVVGGGVSEVPLRQPVVSLTLQAARIGSSQPAYGAVEEVAELILADTWTDENGRTDAGHRDVSPYLPSGYNPAAVRVVSAMNEPRRQPGDAGSYAKYTMDIQIFWVAT